ncbi:MAG TPA: hypothetical protein QF480_06910, partial [Bacteroidales bacterium]|nr:hypothetical protein [Bacteroidales bacterium]
SVNEKSILEEIEQYLDSKINKLDISKKDYFETMEFSNESHSDWKSLIQNSDDFEKRKKKKKKQKR